jgi:RNA polymerase sigma-70 factor (ECF subfamily)
VTTPDATRAELSKAFRALFEEELVYVCQVLRRLGVADRDLDDAAQEVFVAVHAHFGEYDPARPPRPWLMAFAFNTASNYRRLARHRHERVEQPDPSLIDEAAERRSRQHEARSVLLRALDELPVGRRDVFLLHDIEGLEAAQIAELLAIPVNTVYSRLRVARAELERIARALEEVKR